MNLKDKTTDELAQMIADKEASIIQATGALSIVEEQHHELKRKIMDLEKDKLELDWPIKMAKRNLSTKRLELRMMENEFWAKKRNA